MRKITQILLFSALTGILTIASPAHAALQGFASTPALMPPGTGSPGVVIGGIPAWYQDLNGVSVQPCLNIANCGLIGLGDPMFNEALPLSYPSNFPSAAFYSDAVALFTLAPSPVDARVVLSLEYTFIDAVTGALIVAPPRPANALGAPYQRQRLILSYPPGVPVPTAGSFTITHPWGVTTFPFGSATCVNNAGGLKCSMTQDIPLVGIIPPNFAAALGIGIPGSQSTFLRDPLAPAGFLGTGAATASFTGAALGNANSIAVADPLGNTGSTTSLTLLVGQLVGLTATPTSITFPVSRPSVTSTIQTVTITNPSTVNPAIIAAPVIIGADAVDFTLLPGAPDCLAPPPVTILANGSCSFGVQFFEAAPGVNGPKSALLSFPVTTPLNMPPVSVSLSGAIDNVAPTVVFTIPTNGAINMPSNNTVTATFSEVVTQITATTFTLVGPVSAVSGTMTFDTANKTASFTPSTILITNATYTATITTGVTDLVGNALAQNFVWSFTTTSPDLTPPTITAVNPPNNAVGVPVNTAITATFSEQMDGASINASAFIVSGGITATSIAFDAATKTATFTPSVALTAGTAYTVTIKGGPGGVKDLAQNTMFADFQFTFLTNFAPTAPVLIFPADGATSLSTSVTLTWVKSTDNDGDPLTYRVFVCSNPAFIGCNAVVVTASAPRVSAVYFAGLGGLGVVVFGLVSISGIKGKKRFIWALVVTSMTGAIIFSCGGSGGGGAESDTSPPTVPAGVTATAVSASQIDVAWTASSDNVGVAGYTVYRGGISLASIATGTSMSVTGLNSSTNYCFTINAHDAAGNESAQSDPACATTQAGVVVPSNVLSFTVVGLNPGTSYYWKVAADDGKGGLTFSETRSFRTQ